MEENISGGLIAKKEVGDALAVTSGLSFFFLCMILPLVGPSGAKTPHAAQNTITFTAVLLLTFLLAGLAVFSKITRRKTEGGPLPLWSIGLCTICIAMLLILSAGGFAI